MEILKNLPVKELAPGFFARLMHGNNSTVSYVEIKQGSTLPMHQHVHEQTTYIIEGELNMEIGGELYPLRAGMIHVIPSNTPHNAYALTDCKVMDFFSPARDDYR